MVEAVELLIAGGDLQRAFLPVAEAARRVRGQGALDAAGRRLDAVPAVEHVVEQARVPSLPRRQIDLEADPSVGVDRLRPGPPHRDHQLTAEILVLVEGAQTPVALAPVAG